jgi:hypothetical protein
LLMKWVLVCLTWQYAVLLSQTKQFLDITQNEHQI